MESAEFRFDPRIQMPLEQASVVGIRAVLLESAGVACVGRRAIVHHTALVICCGAPQLPARGTFPYIHVLQVHKPGVAVALRALMRMARQELQDERHRQPGRSHSWRPARPRCGRRTSCAWRSFDSTISVNNTSRGSSSVLRGVMRRTPSHARYTMGRVPPRMNNVSPGRRSHSRNAFVRFDRNSNDRASKYPTLTE